jgi:hypothetical protein
MFRRRKIRKEKTSKKRMNTGGKGGRLVKTLIRVIA